MKRNDADVVLDEVEARQAQRVGLIRVLLGSLALAALAAVLLAAYFE